MIIITFVDIDVQLIPNGLLILGLIPVSIYVLLFGLENIWAHLFGAIGLSALFFLIGYLGKIFYKEDSMGMGDVKYAFFNGFIFGLESGFLAL